MITKIYVGETQTFDVEEPMTTSGMFNISILTSELKTEATIVVNFASLCSLKERVDKAISKYTQIIEDDIMSSFEIFENARFPIGKIMKKYGVPHEVARQIYHNVFLPQKPMSKLWVWGHIVDDIKNQLKSGVIKDKLSIDMIMDMYNVPEEIAKKIHNDVFPVERPCGVTEAESAGKTYSLPIYGHIIDDMKTRDIFSSISLSRAREIRENLVGVIKTSYNLTEEQAQNVFDLFYVDELEDTRPGNA